MSTKPEIDFIPGPPPAELVITDLVIGTGPDAVPGAHWCS
jgi:peptidylprolyl isomerase